MKKIISLLLSVVMVLSLVSATAFAASATVYLTSEAANTTVNAGDEFKVVCAVPNPATFEGLSAGLFFETSELEVTKITAGTLTYYDEENEEDATWVATAKSTKTTANNSGTITYTFAGTGEVEYSGGKVFTVTFKAKEVAADTVASIKVYEQNSLTGYKNSGKDDSLDAGLNITIKGAAQEEPEINTDNNAAAEDANDAKTWAVAVDANYVAAGDKLIATLTNSNFTGEDATQVVELTVGDDVTGGADWAFNLKVRFKDVANRAATTLAIAKAN